MESLGIVVNSALYPLDHRHGHGVRGCLQGRLEGLPRQRMLAPQWRSTNQFGIADRFNFAGIAGECSVHCQLDEIVAWAHLLGLCRVDPWSE